MTTASFKTGQKVVLIHSVTRSVDCSLKFDNKVCAYTFYYPY